MRDSREKCGYIVIVETKKFLKVSGRPTSAALVSSSVSRYSYFKMSQSLKRDAGKAFGNDPKEGERSAKNKKRKERQQRLKATAHSAEPVALTATPSERPNPISNGAASSQNLGDTPAKQTSEVVMSKTASSQNAEEASEETERRTRPHHSCMEDVETLDDHSTMNFEIENGRSVPSENAAKTSDDVQRKNREKQKKKKAKSNNPTKNDTTDQGQSNHLPIERVVSKKHTQKSEGKQRDASRWSMSMPAGGIFIPHDPILTPDDQFLIIATKKDIQIYATKTSLLVRTIHVAGASSIVAFSQLPGSSQHLVVGLKDGIIKKVDWTSGQRIWTKRLDSNIVSITPTSSHERGDSFLVIVEVHEKQNAIMSLTVDSRGERTGYRSMLSGKMLSGRVCFSADLGVAVVCTQTAILIGQVSADGPEPGLRWEEVSVSGKIVCFDAQISPVPTKTKKGKTTDRPMVNIAVGLGTGEIHLYTNVLNKRSDSNDLNPQRLHWHRAAPRTVKFSPDSNYLVSGGDETVLVMWQLDTNQRQVLPHLTSAILNITVSHRGSAYALRLADNSVMVVSTSDLQPFTNASGLAIDASSAPFLPDATVPAALHPQHSDQLLLAYSSQSLTPGLKPSEKSVNMLQTYNTAAHLQLSRQSLARNLASTINVGGDGLLIHEPNVTHLDISHDGRWLVTVDQWCPNKSELDQLYLSRGDDSSRAMHHEIFLRFWSTNTSSAKSLSIGTWELNTRIDEPVSSEHVHSNNRAVLAMAVSPVRHQVAVADTNSRLKIYSPKARIKGGLPVKDNVGNQLFSWTCDHDLSFQETSEFSVPKSSTLAFSEDGSVLAASWASTSDARAHVYLIEPKLGSKTATLPDLVSAGRSSLAFCGQKLLALSSTLRVLDTVTMQTKTVFDVEHDFTKNRFDASKSRLAVNTHNSTAAIALSERNVEKASHVFLYDIYAISGPFAPQKERISENVQILLPDRDRGGFLIVDGEGRILRLTPPGRSTGVSIAEKDPSPNEIQTNRLENVFGKGRKKETRDEVQTRPGTDESREKMALDDVFRFATSSEVPGPAELFSRVAGVVGGGGVRVSV